MAAVDLEKLRASGAGKAIGVLTSGGDAQGPLTSPPGPLLRWL
ncbi:PFKL isoform 5 [Pan troglodytes]|uniref:Phosphofructokinase, liver type n=4 Tax=Homininae TaxID=207598 RepID=F8WEU2_HUMAN|nr:PFKL isoform 2 [Pan troglodytes]PNI55830.1 PFKL isoform 5 [Pan troglodytes]